MDATPSPLGRRPNSRRSRICGRVAARAGGLRGLYHGVPLSHRGGNYTNVLPDTITLYRASIVAYAGPNEERVRAQVVRTVAHEVAHHFGISDDRLREIDAY